MTTKFKIGDAIMIVSRPEGEQYQYCDKYIGLACTLENLNGKNKRNERCFWTNITLADEDSRFNNETSLGRKSVFTSDIILLKDCSPCQIAQAIRVSWKNNLNFAAEPYMAALSNLTDWNSNYGADSAQGVIVRFLTNAQTWKGQSARLIKKCLNDKIR